MTEIEANRNLKEYYTELQKCLERLFMAHDVRASRLVDPSLFKANIFSAILSTMGTVIAEKIPFIGLGFELISKANTIIANNKAGQVSENTANLLGTWDKQKYLAQSIARYLTLRYQKQIKRLMTQEEVESYKREQSESSVGKKIKNTLGEWVDIAKEEILSIPQKSPCKEAAGFAASLITLAFHDEKIKSLEESEISIEEQIALYILKPPKPIDHVINDILSALGTLTILAKDEDEHIQEWILLEMYQKPGIETEEGEKYSNKNHHPEKYGFRHGTEEEIANLSKQKNRHDNIIIEEIPDNSAEVKEKLNKLEEKQLKFDKKHKKLKTKVDAIEKNSPRPNNTEYSVGNNNLVQVHIKESKQINNSHSVSNHSSEIIYKETYEIKEQVTKLTNIVVEHDEVIDNLKNTPNFFKSPKKRSNKNPIVVNQGNDRLSVTRQDIIRALENYIEKTSPKKGPILFFISRSEQSLKFLEDKIALAESITKDIEEAEDLNEIKRILEDGIEADAMLCRREGTVPNTLTAILSQFLNERIQRILNTYSKDNIIISGNRK